MDGNVPHKPQDPYGSGYDLIIVSFEKINLNNIFDYIFKVILTLTIKWTHSLTQTFITYSP